MILLICVVFLVCCTAASQVIVAGNVRLIVRLLLLGCGQLLGLIHIVRFCTARVIF